LTGKGLNFCGSLFWVSINISKEGKTYLSKPVFALVAMTISIPHAFKTVQSISFPASKSALIYKGEKSKR